MFTGQQVQSAQHTTDTCECTFLLMIKCLTMTLDFGEATAHCLPATNVASSKTKVKVSPCKG